MQLSPSGSPASPAKHQPPFVLRRTASSVSSSGVATSSVAANNNYLSPGHAIHTAHLSSSSNNNNNPQATSTLYLNNNNNHSHQQPAALSAIDAPTATKPTLASPSQSSSAHQIRIESPKNMHVVQPAIFQPYKEVSKPFEMSDFYKYSTKFRAANASANTSPSSSGSQQPNHRQ